MEDLFNNNFSWSSPHALTAIFKHIYKNDYRSFRESTAGIAAPVALTGLER
jgi:hypothetical protein